MIIRTTSQLEQETSEGKKALKNGQQKIRQEKELRRDIGWLILVSHFSLVDQIVAILFNGWFKIYQQAMKKSWNYCNMPL